METILTVLFTLGVVALLVTVWGVFRLSRRVNDLELVRMEIIDLEGKFEKELENEVRERSEQCQDIHKRIDEYQVQLESSIDRRFDKIWTEWHNLDDKVKQLDKEVNPKVR